MLEHSDFVFSNRAKKCSYSILIADLILFIYFGIPQNVAFLISHCCTLWAYYIRNEHLSNIFQERRVEGLSSWKYQLPLDEKTLCP